MSATGCGRVGFDAVAALGGADAADSSGPDAAGSVDAMMWSAPQPFPELMAGVTTQDPSVTADRLELYFASGRAPGCGGSSDIWVTTRAMTTDPWSTPTCVASVSSSLYDDSPEISRDGLTLYWSSNRTPTLGGADIYVSTRATRASAWSAPARVAAVSSAANEANVAISGDGQTMVIDSDQSGNRDLYVSTWSGTAWSTPLPIAAVTTADTEGAPGLDHDGSRLYFSRGIEADQTSFDIYMSDRIGGVFGTATAAGQLNSPAQDGDPFPTDDGYLFMSSTRGGTVDIYEADPR
jgi:Tol biopolymer transport system component